MAGKGLYGTNGTIAAPPYRNGPYTWDQNVTVDANLTVNGTFTFGDAATDNLIVQGDLRVIDDRYLHFGTNEDVSFEYDEDGDDVLKVTGADIWVVGNSGAQALKFRDTDISINSGADGRLDIDADGEVEITGGVIDVNAGAAAAGAGAAGSAVTVDSGAGGSGAGGATGGAGGAITVTSSNGGTETTGTAGAGGAASLVSGTGGATSGAAGTGGAGGAIAITAGAGGADGEGGSGTGGAGGSITLTPGTGGAGNTAGAAGTIVLAGSSPVNATSGGIRTIQAVDDVHDTTPTDAQLDTAFGTPASLGRGFIGTVDDADGDTNFYVCVTSDASWYYVKLTKAA